MRRLFATLISVVFASSLALGQDLRQATLPANTAAQTTEAIRQKAFIPNLPFPFSKSRSTESTAVRIQIDHPIPVVPVSRIVVRDGSVYFEMLDMLIPFPGGGASGCFSVDLPERREKLRKAIEAFPPLPSLPAPSRQ